MATGVMMMPLTAVIAQPHNSVAIESQVQGSNLSFLNTTVSPAGMLRNPQNVAHYMVFVIYEIIVEKLPASSTLFSSYSASLIFIATPLHASECDNRPK